MNYCSREEAAVEEISGVAFIFNQKFFKDLEKKYGIALENIVYYKDATHYFVMTAKKSSLLGKGVLVEVRDLHICKIFTATQAFGIAAIHIINILLKCKCLQHVCCTSYCLLHTVYLVAVWLRDTCVVNADNHQQSWCVLW